MDARLQNIAFPLPGLSFKVVPQLMKKWESSNFRTIFASDLVLMKMFMRPSWHLNAMWNGRSLVGTIMSIRVRPSEALNYW